MSVSGTRAWVAAWTAGAVFDRAALSRRLPADKLKY